MVTTSRRPLARSLCSHSHTPCTQQNMRTCHTYEHTYAGREHDRCCSHPAHSLSVTAIDQATGEVRAPLLLQSTCLMTEQPAWLHMQRCRCNPMPWYRHVRGAASCCALPHSPQRCGCSFQVYSTASCMKQAWQQQGVATASPAMCPG
jgi:hypothetical protein